MPAPIMLFRLAAAGASAAGRPYLTITSPAVKEAGAGFRTPPPETGMVIWWGMDGAVDEAVVNRAVAAHRKRAPAARSVALAAPGDRKTRPATRHPWIAGSRPFRDPAWLAGTVVSAGPETKRTGPARRSASNASTSPSPESRSVVFDVPIDPDGDAVNRVRVCGES